MSTCQRGYQKLSFRLWLRPTIVFSYCDEKHFGSCILQSGQEPINYRKWNYGNNISTHIVTWIQQSCFIHWIGLWLDIALYWNYYERHCYKFQNVRASDQNIWPRFKFCSANKKCMNLFCSFAIWFFFSVFGGFHEINKWKSWRVLVAVGTYWLLLVHWAV